MRLLQKEPLRTADEHSRQWKEIPRRMVNNQQQQVEALQSLKWQLNRPQECVK
jgi:hypothetical protein